MISSYVKQNPLTMQVRSGCWLFPKRPSTLNFILLWLKWAKKLHTSESWSKTIILRFNHFFWRPLHLVHYSLSNNKISKFEFHHQRDHLLRWTRQPSSYDFTRCRNGIFTLKMKSGIGSLGQDIFILMMSTAFSRRNPNCKLPAKQMGMWCERIRHLNQHRPILKFADWLKKTTRPSQDLRVIAIWWLTLLGRFHRCSRLPDVFHECHAMPFLS